LARGLAGPMDDAPKLPPSKAILAGIGPPLVRCIAFPLGPDLTQVPLGLSKETKVG